MRRKTPLLLLTSLFFCWNFAFSPVYAAPKRNRPTVSQYRNWDYLVEKLIKDGVDPELVKSVYQSTHMPVFTTVPFGLNPKESHQQYRNFTQESRVKLARAFLAKHKRLFDDVESYFGVDRNVIAAILLIETHFGKVTGKSIIVYRLSRLAVVSEPSNVNANYLRLRKTDRSVTKEAVATRATYVHELFYPELKAVFEIAKRKRLNPFSIKGSFAGAFGYPQFLPGTYLRFGVDGDGDKKVSLFTVADSVASVANFLSSYGWRNDAPREAKKAVIWRYNRSDAYVEAVLGVAARLGSK